MDELTMADFMASETRSSGEVVCVRRCPVCGSDRWKTYINPTNGLWYCHAGEHGGGGKVEAGLPSEDKYRYLTDVVPSAYDRQEWKQVQLPEWDRLGRKAVRYLQRRGISEAQATLLGMVQHKERLRIIVPYRGEDGRIIYWNARAYSTLEDGPKYMAASGRHPLYVLPDWRRRNDKLVIVEGVFDAIAVAQHTGGTVAALGGKALPKYLTGDLIYLAAGREVVVLLDSDAVKDAVKLRTFLQDKCDVRMVVLPDGEDPSSMGERLEAYL